MLATMMTHSVTICRRSCCSNLIAYNKDLTPTSCHTARFQPTSVLSAIEVERGLMYAVVELMIDYTMAFVTPYAVLVHAKPTLEARRNPPEDTVASSQRL
jgi:hypothetical protein